VLSERQITASVKNTVFLFVLDKMGEFLLLLRRDRRKDEEWNVQTDMKVGLIICKYQRFNFSFQVMLLACAHAPPYVWNKGNQSLKVYVHLNSL
jgi:hypothetical protein